MKLAYLLGMLPFEIERAVCSKLNSTLGRRPSSAPFLSGDTYRSMADRLYDETRSCDPASIFPGALVFVSSMRLEEFAERALPEIRNRFVLITHQGDVNIDRGFAGLADHPMVAHWFAQNCLLEHPKVTPLPIGLEDRWRHNNGELSDFKRVARASAPRIERIAYAFTLETNLDERVACYKALKSCKAAQELPKGLNSSLYRKIVGRYMLVASPPGNGLDCHRTWEAMYLRCVPVVEDNYMHRRFLEQGFPLVIVKDWRELGDWTKEDVKARYAESSPRAMPEALCAEWWKRAFTSVS
jgi:hypothetical protein